MKSFTSILILSFGVNILLAGWWLKSRTVQSTPANLPVSIGSATQPAEATTIADNSPAPTGAQAHAQTGSTGWAGVWSDDAKELIRRLRAAGCPEETIQNLVLAEVNRRYQARVRDLWPDRYKEQTFWETQKRDAATSKKSRETMQQQRELEKEKSAELVSLLGVDPEKAQRQADGTDSLYDYRGRQLGFLPESKRDAVGKYLEGFEDKMQDFYERTRGLYDSEARAERRQLEAERLKGLAQYLTPQEIREYDLRNSQTATQLSFDLQGLSLNREQYEAIFDIRNKYGDSIYNYADSMDSAGGQKRVEETKKSMIADLASALGPEKAKEYERSQDYSYQQLSRMAKRYDLPADTAPKVYDYKQVAEETAKQVRENTTLTAEQRQTQLQQIRAETERTVKSTIGDQNYQRYLSQGGFWINNLAPTQRPPGAPGTAARSAVIIQR
jgi:hypothetical protein